MRKFVYTMKYQIIIIIIIIIIFNILNFLNRKVNINSEAITSSLILFTQIIGLVFTVIIAFSFFSFQSTDNKKLNFFFAINDELNKLKNLLIKIDETQYNNIRYHIALVLDALECLNIYDFPYSEQVDAKINDFLNYLDSEKIHYKGMSTKDNFIDYVISILFKIEKFNGEFGIIEVKIWLDEFLISEIRKLVIILISNISLIVLYKMLTLNFYIFNFFINPTILITSLLFVLYSLLEVFQFIRDYYTSLSTNLKED